MRTGKTVDAWLLALVTRPFRNRGRDGFYVGGLMPFKNNNPGCPCCETSCVVLSDDFDRDNSSDLGSDWVSGDWEIKSNAAWTDTADTKAITVDEASGSTFIRSYGKFAMSSGETDDAVGVIIGYSDDNNYAYALFIDSSGGDGGADTLELHNVVAGVDSTIASTTSTQILLASIEIILCFYLPANGYDGVLVARFVTFSGTNVILKGRSNQTGRKGGMLTGQVTSPNEITNAFGYVLTHEGEDCDHCVCRCTIVAEPDPPPQFELTLAGVTAAANCTSFECSQFNDTFPVNCYQSADCEWRGGVWISANTPPASSCTADDMLWFFNVKIALDGSDYVLTVTVEADNTPFTLITFSKNYGSSPPETWDFSGESITLDSIDNDPGTNCDFSSITCALTAAN